MRSWVLEDVPFRQVPKAGTLAVCWFKKIINPMFSKLESASS